MLDAFNEVQIYARKNYDGHFTLMSFTGNWRACYGTIESRHAINYMISGTTAEEALKNLLNNPIDVYQIEQKLG